MVLDIIPKLDGRRVRIVYDQTYPAISLVFCHILSEFKSKRLVIAVYTDTSCRKLREQYNFMVRHNPEVAEILDKANIFKIGKRENIPFGKLCEFIPEDDLINNPNRFEDLIEQLRDDDLVLLLGFYLFPAIYGKDFIGKFLRLIDLLPENLTLISLTPHGLYDNTTAKLVDRFFDVVLRIAREEEPLVFEEEVYVISVEHSITREIEPKFGRFRILPDGRLSKI
jgi:hypothetical protein